MKYKLVIFDFDGTLADSFALFLETWKVTSQLYKFKFASEDEIEKLRGLSAREVIAEISLPWWKLFPVGRYMRKHMQANIDQVKLFDDIENVLRSLKSKGIRVAIVTSNSESNVRKVLGQMNCSLIDYFACGASIFGKKSKTHSVIKASGALNQEVLCVGDELRDFDVAQALDLDFAAVSWGYTHPAQLEQLPDTKTLRNPHDVLSLMGQ